MECHLGHGLLPAAPAGLQPAQDPPYIEHCGGDHSLQTVCRLRILTLIQTKLKGGSSRAVVHMLYAAPSEPPSAQLQLARFGSAVP